MLRAPPAAARRGPTYSRPHFATQAHPENRLDFLSVFPNPPLAACEPLAGIWPVNRRPLSLTRPRDLGVEETKLQGVI